MKFPYFQEKLAAFEKNLLEERKKRLADRKEERKAERRNKWVKEREEEKQKAIDEALKRGEALITLIRLLREVRLLSH